MVDSYPAIHLAICSMVYALMMLVMRGDSSIDLIVAFCAGELAALMPVFLGVCK